MSKENVLSFLTDATKDEKLKLQLEETASPDELVGIANEAGYKFSSQQVDEVLNDLKTQPGFFGALAEAVLEIFSPNHDDYPATGIQAFSGDPNPKNR